MKKYILGVALIIVFVVVAVQAQTSLFVRFVGSDTVYKAYHSVQEFFDDGGSFDQVQLVGQEFGSVSDGGSYNATSTKDITAGTFKQLKTGVSILGSVIVASSSGSTFTLWNATSTTDVSSTTIVQFKASVGEGTYTFDGDAPRGLIMAPPTGFNGFYVITWR